MKSKSLYLTIAGIALVSLFFCHCSSGVFNTAYQSTSSGRPKDKSVVNGRPYKPVAKVSTKHCSKNTKNAYTKKYDVKNNDRPSGGEAIENHR